MVGPPLAQCRLKSTRTQEFGPLKTTQRHRPTLRRATRPRLAPRLHRQATETTWTPHDGKGQSRICPPGESRALELALGRGPAWGPSSCAPRSHRPPAYPWRPQRCRTDEWQPRIGTRAAPPPTLQMWKPSADSPVLGSSNTSTPRVCFCWSSISASLGGATWADSGARISPEPGTPFRNDERPEHTNDRSYSPLPRLALCLSAKTWRPQNRKLRVGARRFESARFARSRRVPATRAGARASGGANDHPNGMMRRPPRLGMLGTVWMRTCSTRERRLCV
jgi:hypothetical protein